jgi:hypothetical protein
MSPLLNPLYAAGADPELRFLTPAERVQRLAAADPGLLPVLDPTVPPAAMICMIFPVKEDEPAEQPEREGEEPTEPTPPSEPGQNSITRH